MAHNQCIATGPVGAAGTVYVDVGYAAGNCVEAAVTGKLVYGSDGTSIRVRLEGSYDAGATWTPVGDMLFGTASAEKTFIVQSDSTDVFNPGDPLPDNTVRKALPPRLRVSKVVTGTYAGSTLDVWIGLKENAAFKVGQLDTDPAMAANSDARVPSQKAVKTRLDNITSGASPIALAGIETALGAWGISEKGGGRFNAAHYGTSPGATDNIPFINAAIDACYAAGGGEVYLPTHKIYPIKPSGTSNRILLRSGVRLNLGDARLKVAADSPSYQCVATAYGGPSTALSDSGIYGGEIDQNPANHAAANASVDGMFAWLSWNGTRLTFRGTSYISGGTNTIVATSTNNWITTVDGCTFQFIQAPAATPNYDNSALYINGFMTQVTNNRFYSEFDQQAHGAIEIHGPHAIVTGNETHRYWTLVNLTPKDSNSWYADKPYTGHIVSNNVVYDGRQGISFWTASGRTYNQASITNNVINIAQKTGDFRGWHGIGWFIGSGYSGVSEGVQIRNNVIRFEAGDTRTETAAHEALAYSVSHAIGTAGPGVLRNAVISDNIIVDNPLTGLRLGDSLFAGAEHANVLVERNLLVNSGCNRSWHRTQRGQLFLAGKFTNTRIRDNTFIVTDATGTSDQDLTVIAGTLTSGGGNEIVGHHVRVNGGYTLVEATDPATFAYRRPSAGSTLGSVVKKQEVFDQYGASLGFIPIYNSIT